MGVTPESNGRYLVVELPKELEDDHVEHLAAAILASGGMFVEKHVTEKAAKQEITEIDAFGTAWRDGEPHTVLVEATSGKWGNRDLFAVLGKRMYLTADRAVLLHTIKHIPEKGRALLASLQDKLIPVTVADNDGASVPEFVANLCREDESLVRRRIEAIHSLQAWRYAFWTERALLKHLTHDAKCLGDRVPSLGTARELVDRLDECFFLSDPLDQARRLYDFHFEHRRLTKDMIEERMQHAPGEDLSGCSQERAFKECVYNGKLPSVQASMYLQHRARCLLLKAAVDWIMKSAAGRRPGFTLKELLVPESFRAFTEQVAREPDYVMLPQLWQAYVLGWGGFLVTSRAEEEHENIGLEAGLPPERVKAGLEAFDKLFPTGDGGWHYNQSDTTGMTLLKMVPNAFRGLGVQRRRWIYGDSGFLGQLPPLGFKDCKRWAECGYALLQAAT